MGDKYDDLLLARRDYITASQGMGFRFYASLNAALSSYDDQECTFFNNGEVSFINCLPRAVTSTEWA